MAPLVDRLVDAVTAGRLELPLDPTEFSLDNYAESMALCAERCVDSWSGEGQLLEFKLKASFPEKIVKEMVDRGMKHNSDLVLNQKLIDYLPPQQQAARVDTLLSLRELIRRCDKCRDNIASLATTNVAIDTMIQMVKREKWGGSSVG